MAISSPTSSGAPAAMRAEEAMLVRIPPGCTTVTPTVATVGTADNVVPAEGRIKVDVRVESAEEQERVESAMAALTAGCLDDPRVTLRMDDVADAMLLAAASPHDKVKLKARAAEFTVTHAADAYAALVGL